MCSNQRYAEEVINILPGLRYFDAVDIMSVRRSLGGAALPQNQRENDENEESYLIDGENIANISNISYNNSNGADSSRHSEFEVKLRRAVKRQAGEKRFRNSLNPSPSSNHVGMYSGNSSYSYSLR